MMEFIIKKKSKIHGFGMFTSKRIKKGEVFYEIPANKIINKPKRRYAFIGNNKWVNDTKVLNWVNHSCKANTKLDISREKPALIAKRNIKEREEITCDYNKTEKNGEKISCNCGNKKCKEYFRRIE